MSLLFLCLLFRFPHALCPALIQIISNYSHYLMTFDQLHCRLSHGNKSVSTNKRQRLTSNPHHKGQTMHKKFGYLSKLVATGLLVSTAAISANSADTISNNWMQHSAISPNGKTILFSYQGDIYKVSAKGGTATPLTINAAWEGHPIWSKDGKQIAFASDRNGNLDIYLMPATGGPAKRLTHYSADDIPSDFAPGGNKVLFQSSRVDDSASALHPTGALPELYEVSTEGGTPTQRLTTPALNAVWNKKGDKILYKDEKSFESELRKHDRSAFARDIWVYDTKTGTHNQLTSAAGGDHDPVWGKSEKSFYYLSDRSGTFNVWQQDFDNKTKQLTNHTLHAVRSLTGSNKGTLAYLYLGDLYTLKPGKKPQAVKVTFSTDGHGRDEETFPVNGRIREFAVSPNGKEVAFVARGDVFVTSTDYATTKRVTNTATQERSVSFSHDGKSLIYAAERNGRWQIMETAKKFDDEKYFFAATGFDEKRLFDSEEDTFQPLASPDGKKVAFIAGRDALKVYDRDSKEISTALSAEYNYSYADGDITFSWAPDSEWLTVDFAANGRLFFTNIAVVPADGSAAPKDISLSGYTDTGPNWHSSGGIVTWYTARYGQRDHGSHGSQYDVFAGFLNQEAWDKFNLSKEELELKKEADAAAEEAEEEANKETEEKTKSADKADKTKAEEKKKDDEEEKAKSITIEWDKLQDRQRRLTIHSSDIAGAVLSKDADKLFYLSAFDSGYDLWVHDFREQETKKLVPLNADRVGMTLSDDGKNLFLLADGGLMKVATSGGAPKPVKVSANFTLKATEERAYLFEHIWRQVNDKFYRPGFHGQDWAKMREDYRKKVGSTNNSRDFARLMEEMLGELNGSHTGAYYRSGGGDRTAALGLLFDNNYAGEGARVREVLKQSPLNAQNKTITAGMILSAIDGTKLDATTNRHALLKNKADERTRLTFKPVEGEPFDVVIKPVAARQQGRWMYERWVESRRKAVNELSGGRLGYVHVPNMSDRTYRSVYRDLFGRVMNKEAVIVDTRFNGGGDLTDDLIRLLGGHQYMTNMPRGREAQGEPLTRWTKPSIVLMNEGNYSDGHCFTAAYSGLEMGKTVGMPVPGTCSYVWWETLMSGDIYFGIPQMGVLDTEKEWLENKQLEPMIKVSNTPETIAKGEDAQLKTAVETMLSDLDTSKE